MTDGTLYHLGRSVSALLEFCAKLIADDYLIDPGAIDAYEKLRGCPADQVLGRMAELTEQLACFVGVDEIPKAVFYVHQPSAEQLERMNLSELIRCRSDAQELHGRLERTLFYRMRDQLETATSTLERIRDGDKRPAAEVAEAGLKIMREVSTGRCSSTS